MTDHNYKKEEEVPETPEIALDNWNAASTRLDGVVADTATKLDRNYELLNWVESQVTEDDKPLVQESKAITHQMATRIAEFDAIRTQAKGFMKEMLDRHQRLAGDYEELQNDVVDMNDDNALVGQLIEGVEQGVYENMSEYYMNDALEAAYEEVFTEIHEGIKDCTNETDWTLVYRMSNVLTGQDEPTDEQRDLLKRLIESFRKPEDVNDHE